MPVTDKTVVLHPETVERIQAELRRQQLGGWLLYDFHALNGVASGLLGLPALSRRYFVLIPATGAPVALTHRIEQQPWRGWIGEKRVYLSWRELEAELRAMLTGIGSVAMEYMAGDATPYVDLVPAGVVEMVRAAGAEVASSAELVSTFYARWSHAGLASHRRAAATLHAVVHAAFARVGEVLASGGSTNEWQLREWVRGAMRDGGLRVGVDCIVAVNANAANPHYAPSAERHASIRPGDLLLIDLFGKEDEDAVYADQTWMAFVGDAVPERLQSLWNTLRDARDAAVALLRERHRTGEPVSGGEVDDAARAVIERAGLGEHFIHRTGHSIDRELHGSGPNIDNLETRDVRRLIPGVGFSIEPGIYLAGDVGFRTEIDVYMSEAGPEVTTPEPQTELVRIPVGLPR